jgi:hypothetical protein
MFDWGEELINEAETLYLDTKKHLFTDLDVAKFMIKKSSFMKKYGFFQDAIDILEILNT